MQLKGSLYDGKVSEKGFRLLDKIAQQAGNRVRCIYEAGERFAQSTSDTTWIVLHVWPGREQAVEKALTECDIQAFVPLCMGPKRRRHHKELPPSLKPVFVGYIFVRCAPTEYAIQGLHSFEHVRGVVGGWPVKLKLTDEIINQFRDMVAVGKYDDSATGEVLPVGCKVRINEGPFARFEGEVVAFGGDGKGSPVIELEIFGRKTPMMIPIAMLSRL